jgi:hypothetical protein
MLAIIVLGWVPRHFSQNAASGTWSTETGLTDANLPDLPLHMAVEPPRLKWYLPVVLRLMLYGADLFILLSPVGRWMPPM